MKFEGINNEQSPLERDPEMLGVVRNQMQAALAFSHLPMDRSHEEEEAIIIARLKKNSPKFNIVFDEMLKNNPNLLEDWQNDSHEVLATIEEQMKLIPDLPLEEDEKHWKKMEDEGGQQKAA
jgi:hypothetical protein